MAVALIAPITKVFPAPIYYWKIAYLTLLFMPVLLVADLKVIVNNTMTRN